MRRAYFFPILAASLVLASCQASLRPDFATLLGKLGKPAGIDAGDCKSAAQIKQTYMQELESKTASLGETLLPFAEKAAKICPQSHLFIRTTADLDLKDAAAALGAAPFEGDGKMQAEPWLFLRAAAGKVIGIEVDLEKL